MHRRRHDPRVRERERAAGRGADETCRSIAEDVGLVRRAHLHAADPEGVGRDGAVDGHDPDIDHALIAVPAGGHGTIRKSTASPASAAVECRVRRRHIETVATVAATAHTTCDWFVDTCKRLVAITAATTACIPDGFPRDVACATVAANGVEGRRRRTRAARAAAAAAIEPNVANAAGIALARRPRAARASSAYSRRLA